MSYIDRHIRIMDRFERIFLKPVYEALQGQIMKFVNDVKEHGYDKAKRNLDQTIFNDDIGKVLEDMYGSVGSFFAHQTTKEISEKKGFGINEELIREILNYFRTELLMKAILPISQTTIEQIRQAIIEGEQEGWGVDKIISELENSEITKWRARMIVRTEAGKAQFVGNKVGIDKSEWEVVQKWLSAHDDRVRHSHVNVDGDRVQGGEMFKVPIYKKINKMDVKVGFDLMEGPHDPRASAANVINCRCTTTKSILRDSEGNPVLKRQLVHG